jgi:hypothetical protein
MDSSQIETNLDAELVELRGLVQLAGHCVQADHARAELGRRLIVVRQRWPKSGPKAGGWIDFLHSIGLPKASACRYMSMARGDAPKAKAHATKKPGLDGKARKLLVFIEAMLQQEHEVLGPLNYGVGLTPEQAADYDERCKVIGRETHRQFETAFNQYRDAWIAERAGGLNETAPDAEQQTEPDEQCAPVAMPAPESKPSAKLPPLDKRTRYLLRRHNITLGAAQAKVLRGFKPSVQHRIVRFMRDHRDVTVADAVLAAGGGTPSPWDKSKGQQDDNLSPRAADALASPTGRQLEHAELYTPRAT